MRVLVTGASGFLGSWTVKALAQAGHEITACDLRRRDRLFRAIAAEACHDQVSWPDLDVADGDAVEALAGEAAPEVVIHLAALLIPPCWDDPVAAAQVNVVGHINMFQAARRHGVRQVVYASSLAARIRNADGAHSTIYGTFKDWNESFAATYFAQYGLPSIGLRPAIVYGPGREAGATAFVNQAIASVAAGEDHQLPLRWQSRLEYVAQVAGLFQRCAEAEIPGALASDVSATLTTDDDFIAAVGRVVPGCQVSAASDGPTKMAAPDDIAALQELVGKWPHIDLDDGIRRTIQGMALLERSPTT
ncbi:MAG: NAD(P)-dependent oxidoreductase [Alphaproteobacteria bacterium]